MYVGTGGVEVGAPLHADAGLRVNGAAGVDETVAGTTHTTNHLNAAGTFEWRRDGTTVFASDASRNLTSPNSLVFPVLADSLAVGNTAATTYTIASTSTSTPAHVSMSVAGTARVSTTASHPLLTNALEFPVARTVVTGDTRATSNGTPASPAFEFSGSPGSGMLYDVATSSVGVSADGDLGVVVTQGATDTNVALGVTSFPASYNGGDRVVYLGEAGSEPTANVANTSVLCVSGDDLRYEVDVSVDDENAVLNAVARRARVTLAAHSVPDATSSNLDGETWTDVDSAGVSGTTTGALSIPGVESTVLVVVEASWASNAVGFRRLSVTTGVGHTVEATVTCTAVSGDVTVQTATLMRRLEPGDAGLQFAAQVYQNSTAALDVDVVMTVVRLN
jgi:hypothetical protein